MTKEMVPPAEPRKMAPVVAEVRAEIDEITTQLDAAGGSWTPR